MTPTMGYQAYRHVAETTVIDHKQILLKLYEGALTFLERARHGMLQGNIKERGENVSKVLAIVSELECALDLEAGGEIAANLSRLYQYMSAQLTQVTIKHDVQALDSVKALLLMLQEAFTAAAHTVKEEAASGHTSPEPHLAGAAVLV